MTPEQELIALRAKVTQLEATNKALADAHAKLSLSVSTLTRTNSLLTDQIAVYAKLSQSNATLTDTNSLLTDQLARSTSERLAIRNKLITARDSIAALEQALA